MATTPCIYPPSATAGLQATGPQPLHDTKGCHTHEHGTKGCQPPTTDRANGSVAYNPTTGDIRLRSTWFTGEGLSFRQVDDNVLPCLDAASRKAGPGYYLICAGLNRRARKPATPSRPGTPMLRLQKALRETPGLRKNILRTAAEKAAGTNATDRQARREAKDLPGFVPNASAAEIRRALDQLTVSFDLNGYCDALLHAIEIGDAEMCDILREIEAPRTYIASGKREDKVREVFRDWSLGRYAYTRDLFSALRNMVPNAKTFCSDDCIRDVDLTPVSPSVLAAAMDSEEPVHALCLGGWVRDLTREGVEANPGPGGDVEHNTTVGSGPEPNVKTVARRSRAWNPQISGRGKRSMPDVGRSPVICTYVRISPPGSTTAVTYVDLMTFLEGMVVDAHQIGTGSSGVISWVVVRDPAYSPNFVASTALAVDSSRMHVMATSGFGSQTTLPLTQQRIVVPQGWVLSYVYVLTSTPSPYVTTSVVLHVSNPFNNAVRPGPPVDPDYVFDPERFKQELADEWIRDLTREGVEPNPGPQWVRDLTAEGIEPNPGPQGHGDDEVATETKVALQDVGKDGAPQTNQMLDMAERPNESAGGAVGPIAELAAVVTEILAKRKGVINNNVGTLENVLKNYAQTFRPFGSIQGSTAEVCYASVYENWSSRLSAFLTAGNDYSAGDSYLNVGTSAPECTPIQFTKVGSSLLVAARAGDAVTASQILRINTLTVNGDSFLRAICASANKYEGGACGSFMLPLLRCFGYIYAFLPLLGPESAAYMQSTNMRLRFPPAVDANLGRYWPLSSANDNVRPGIAARICTYQDFCSVRYGGTPFIANYSPSTWGQTTAVVPIQTDSLERGNVNVAWTLLHMEYPYRDVFWSADMLDDNGNNLGVAGGTPNPGLSPASLKTRLQGPVQRVLFVICNLNSLGVGSTTLMRFGEAAIGGVNLDNNANSPYAAGGDAAIGPVVGNFWNLGEDTVRYYMSAMEMWQRNVGSEGDFRSALMVAADAFHRVAPPAFRTQAGIEGHFCSFGASIPPFSPPTGNMTQGVLDAMLNATTTPSGARCTNNIAIVQAGWYPTINVPPVDPEAYVDLYAGVISVTNPLPMKMPQNNAALGGLLRALCGKVTTFCEIIMRSSGYSMQQLFSNTNAENLMAWDDYFSTLNGWLASVCGGRFSGSYKNAVTGTVLQWYHAFCPSSIRAGWARVPYFTLMLNGAKSLKPPQKNAVGPFGEFVTGQDFPLLGNTFEVLKETVPTLGEEAALKYLNLASAIMVIDRLNGPLMLRINVATGTESGTQIIMNGYPVGRPNNRGVLYLYSQYGGDSPSAGSQVDLPYNALPPIRDSITFTNLKTIFTDSWVANYTRGHTQYVPNLRLVRLDASVETMILTDAGGPNVASGRLSYFRKAATGSTK